MQPFETIEHTGDVKMRVTGRTTEELFVNAGFGMMYFLFGDIACEGGVRLLKSGLLRADVTKGQIVNLANQMQRDVPSGVGRVGRLELSPKNMSAVLEWGVAWAVEKGYATEEDRTLIEDSGNHLDARPEYISDRARARPRPTGHTRRW